jgi:hypothetical protein
MYIKFFRWTIFIIFIIFIFLNDGVTEGYAVTLKNKSSEGIDYRNLHDSEIRLPSGVVIRITSSISIEQYTKAIEKFLNFTKKDRPYSESKINSTDDAVTLQLEVINNSHGLAPQLICDQYIGYVLQLKMKRVSINFHRLIISVYSKKMDIHHKCIYKIRNDLRITRTDGTELASPRYAYRQFKMEGLGDVLIAPLATTKEKGIKLPFSDFVLIFPYVTPDKIKLERYLNVVTQNVCSLLKCDETNIRFLVVRAGKAKGRFLMPGSSIFALRKSDGQVVFIENIQLKFASRVKEHGHNVINKKFVEITFFNSKLWKAFLHQSNAESRLYLSDGVYHDAKKIVDLVGDYAASAFGVSDIVIVSDIVLRYKRIGFRVPIKYKRRGKDWAVIGRKP